MAFILNFIMTVFYTVSLFFFVDIAWTANTVHSWIVTIGQLMSRLGIGKGKVPRSRDNPFGFSGRFYFFYHVVSVIFLSCGAFYSLMSGIIALRRPAAVAQELSWHFGLFGLAVSLTVFVSYIFFHFCARLRGPVTLLAFVRKSKSVDLITTLLQETGLLITMFLAVFSAIVKHTGYWLRMDGVAAVMIGMVMLGSAVVSGLKMQDLLIGESADLSVIKRMYALLQKEEWIKEIVDLHSVQLDEDSILLAIKAVFNDQLSSSELNSLINGIEKDIQLECDHVKRVFFYQAPVTLGL